MRRLFANQLAEASKPSGEVDFERLADLVAAGYENSNRSIALMMAELDALNQNLERQVAERTSELVSQNSRFNAALNHMSQALLMFGGDQRLLVCNNKYIEMYGVSQDFLKPGCSLVDLLHERKRMRTFAGDPESYRDKLIAAMAEGRTFKQMVELPDGRTIAVINHPMAGGGWVATHEDITERRRAEEKIAHMARHDSLTDLPNRLMFHECLGDALDGVKDGGKIAVLYLDLDHFKAVNDTLGHHIGDELLKVIAARLRDCVRAGDTVARVGGDEFAIVQKIANPSESAALAIRICEAVNAPCELNGHALVANSSIGIAIAPHDGREPGELVKNADMALYGAKSEGRGTYRFFEQAMDRRVKHRRELEIDLRRALAEAQFEMHYQPLLDLQEGRVSCCEALIRWRHPERGLVHPGEFIPVAEEIGLIVPLGEWVIRQACADTAHLPNEVKVAVNLSPIQVTSSNLLPTVIGALAASRLPARRLEIEITESVLMQNTEATLATLHQLRELGVKISLDDFGTGYSSLSYLRKFPFHKLKIDRSFISGLNEGDDSFAIVRAVTSMARSLGMITTAEGVETQQQLEQVRALGCTEAQGYFFSRPRPLPLMIELLLSHASRPAKIA